MLRVVLVVAALAGACGGRMALEAAAESQPPVTWAMLIHFFLGTVVALLIVLGLQVARRNTRGVRWGWLFFLVAGVYTAASKTTALVVAAPGALSMPETFLFLTLGIAMLAGLGFVRIAFKRAFIDEKVPLS